MGFGLQLRLLLWKNFTLKKRAPITVLIEVLIPLVLFLILMSIRFRREPDFVPEEVFPVRALPSSGIIPLLQQFCNNKDKDEHGFPIHPNASIGTVLDHIADILSSPGLSAVDDLKMLPQDYNEFHKNLNKMVSHAQNVDNFTIREILTDPSEVQQFMQNLSIPPSVAEGVLNSTVNSRELAKYVGVHGKNILKQLTWSGNHSVPGDNLNKFPMQSSSPGGADLLGLLLFGTMSDLMGAAPRLPSTPRDPATNFTVQQPSDTSNVQPNTSSCNATELERVLVFKGANQKETLQHLCQLTPQQAQLLAYYLQSHVDRTAAMRKLNVTREDVIAYNKSYTKLRGDLKNLTEFVHLVQEGVELAQLLRLNLSFTQHLENKTRWQRNRIYLREMWKNLGPIICGPDPDDQPKKKVIDHMYDYRCRTSGCRTRAMRLMLYLLLHDPKIAYSPNGTAADKIIEKANRTFSDIEKLQHLAEDWLNTSQEIRKVLRQNDSQYYLGLVLNSKHKCLNHHNNMANNLTGYKPSDYFGQYQGLDELLTRSCDNTNPLITQLDTIDRVARLWLEMASHLNLNIFKGFKDEESLVNYALNINNSKRGDTSKVVAGIVFMNIKVNASLPPHVKYKIRMNATYFTPATDSIRDRYWMPGPQSWNQRYYDLGFTWLQDQIERAIVDLHGERDVIKPAVYLHEMPYPCYVRDNFMFIIEHMMPLCMTVSWIYTVALAVQAIVYEKEQRLKEVMKMMGLSNAVHWVAWFITSLCVMSITVFLLVIILKYGKVLYYSDPLVVWVFLMVFAVVTIVFCFLISVFFSKAKISSACGGIIYFLTYLPYVFISIREEAGSVNVSGKEKMAASLFSTSAFGLGARYFAIYEEEGVGMQWSNLGKSPVRGDDFNLLTVLYCMIMDTVIYAILVWYIEAVHPGSYGLPRPWYFICQPSYWFGHNTQSCPKISRRTFQMMTADELEDMPQAQGLLAYEREPIHLSLGVTIENLVKIYKEGKKLAVDGLTLNLYEGQITSFLGHNGAGKTTTMSILTGLFPPTAGTAYVYGCDIRVDMDKIRRSLGMCPQHNVLFDRMTVDEHLWFYARLKGMPERDVKREMDQLVMDVGLPTKRHCAVETLSGGMKRKLSVAMAFAAGSRTVILDEPTAGVDPYARRAIWDLLIKYKKGRTILLSTHFMDEADLLGDRIAIVSNGKLRCVGSPLFLKSHFGDGYHLTLVKKRERTPQGSIVNVHVSSTESSSALETSEKTSCENTLQPDHPNVGEDHVKKVTNFIKSHVPAARLEQNTTQEFTFVLPDNSVKRGGFEIFFSDLEAKQDELGIDSFGLTDTSLEEVFLKVTDVSSRDDSELDSSNSEESLNPGGSSSTMLSGDCAGLDDERDEDIRGDGEIELNDLPNVRYDARTQLLSPEIQEEASYQYADHTPLNTEFQGVGSHTLTGASLKLQQFYGLVIKRFHYARRNFKGVISQILLPAIFISIAMVMALSFPKQPDQPPLELTPSMFPRPNYIPFANEAKGVNQLASRLDKTLTLLSGVGATCCLRSVNLTTTEVKPSKDDLAQLFNNSCSVSIDEVSDEYFKPSNLHLSYIYTNGSNVSHSVTHKDTGRGCRCSLNKTAYICDRGAAGPHPKELVTITLDTLQNITGRNISKYLLYTTETFRLHRYGSLSFGEVVSFVPQKLDKVKISSVRRLAIREAVKAWYNNKGYHALPTYLNVMNNAILRASLAKGKGNPAAYGITVFNHPFNHSDSNQLSARYMRQGTDLVIAIFVIIAMSFVPASFVVFLVTERSSKAKHLQFVSGVDPVIYWLSNYVWDLCNYLIPACACITLLHVFKVPAYSSDTNFPAVVCLFLLYGWSITPIMYPGAFFFSEASSAYVFMIVVNLFVGVTATVTTFILQLFPDDVVLTKIFDALRVINLGFPNYCLGTGLLSRDQDVDAFQRTAAQQGSTLNGTAHKKKKKECPPGYVLSESEECIPITCEVGIGDACASCRKQELRSADNQCATCNPGYWLNTETFTCSSFACEITADGRGCAGCQPLHLRTGDNHCSSCHAGFQLIGGACNPLPCIEGDGPSCKKCVPQSNRTAGGQCLSCNTGYQLTSDLQCKPLVCRTGGGAACKVCKALASTSADGQCSQCNLGYYLDSDTEKCTPWPCREGHGAGCKACKAQIDRTAIDQCQECNPGYQLHADGSCHPFKCTEVGLGHPCKACRKQADRRADNQCAECNVGFRLGPETFMCIPHRCNEGPGSACKSCASSKEATHDGECLECNAGYELMPDGSCRPYECTPNQADAGCKTCQLLASRRSDQQCASCNEGFALAADNVSCVAVDCTTGPGHQCRRCTSDRTQCDDCNRGYYLTIDRACRAFECHPSPASGCKTCRAQEHRTAKGQCSACNEGYFLDDDFFCKPWPCKMSGAGAACKVCRPLADRTGPNQCQECNAGHLLSEDLTCIPFSCSTGAGNACNRCRDLARLTSDDQCERCNFGYRLSSSFTCEPYQCSTGENSSCKTCKDQTSRGMDSQCSACNAGYELKDSMCRPYVCNSGAGAACKTCKPLALRTQDEECAECNPGFFLSNGTCKEFSCSVGQGALCQECLIQDARTAENQCMECNKGFYRNAKFQCIPYTCKADEGCSECVSQSLRTADGQCAECRPGYVKTLDNLCEPFTCLTGEGAACKTCRPQGNRTAHGQCLDCNDGYDLNSAETCGTFACSTGPDEACKVCRGENSSMSQISFEKSLSGKTCAESKKITVYTSTELISPLNCSNAVCADDRCSQAAFEILAKPDEFWQCSCIKAGSQCGEGDLSDDLATTSYSLQNCPAPKVTLTANNQCAECNPGYFLGEDLQCKPFTCLMGPGSACKTCLAQSARTGRDQCLECNPGFYRDGVICKPFSCETGSANGCKTCRPEAARTGNDQCSECNPGYGLTAASSCEIFSCFTGDGASCRKCRDVALRTAKNQCMECNRGYLLTEDLKCKKISCTLGPGRECRKCKAAIDSSAKNQCEECNAGYELTADFKCSPFTCVTGTDAGCKVCRSLTRRTAHEQCRECMPGYTLTVDHKCEPLLCDSGSGALCKRCLDQDMRTADDQCAECNPGYTLTEDLTCAAFTCSTGPGSACKACRLTVNATANDQCSECNPGHELLPDGSCKPYTCKIGNGTECKECQDLKLRTADGQCTACNDGFTLTDGICTASPCVKGAACEVCGSGAECDKCSRGYELTTSFACRPHACRTGGGSSCKTCLPQNARSRRNQCASCNPGFMLTADAKCVPFACSIGAGSACKTCKPQGERTAENQCDQCNAGHVLNEAFACVQFRCSTGQGPACKSCRKLPDLTADDQCEACNPGYGLSEDNQCETLSCEEGAGRKCKVCKGRLERTASGQCLECNPGYELNSDLKCEPLSCETGDAVTDCKACVAQEERSVRNHCSECNPGAGLVGALCQHLTCETGVGAACKTCVPQSERTAFDECASCNPGYTLNGKNCQTITCSLGPDEACRTCRTQEARTAKDECESCNPGFFLSNASGTWKCEAYSCSVAPGTGCKFCQEQSTRTGADQCAACNPGYELLPDGRCKAFACSTGLGIGCKECRSAAELAATDQCSKCNPGYYLGEDFKCHSWDCEAGEGAKCKACFVQNLRTAHQQCALCNAGFFRNHEDLSCKPYTCKIGSNESCAMCREQGDRSSHNQCVACNPGYELTDEATCRPFGCSTSDGRGCAECKAQDDRTKEGDCSACNPGLFLTEKSGCQAYKCEEGPKGACKVCQGPSNRTAHNQCQECNFGYELTESLTCKAFDCTPGEGPDCKSCDTDGNCVDCNLGYFLTDEKTCQPYKCEVGEPPACKTCKEPENTTADNQCKDCAPGHRLNELQACVPFLCQRGPGELCKTCVPTELRERDYECASCNSGYQLSANKTCEPFSCELGEDDFCNTCVAQRKRTADNQCASCNEGYFLDDKLKCQKMTCEVGPGDMCQKCGADNRCSSCNAGYRLMASGSCESFPCQTGDDDGCSSCVRQRERSRVNHCGSCNAGYQLSKRGSCEAFVCTTGNGDACRSCPPLSKRKMDNECSACNPGFQLVGAKCVPFTCAVSIGAGCMSCRDQSARTADGQCSACNPGFELTEDFRCRPYTCETGPGDLCKACRTQRGRTSDEQCLECNPGYTLTDGFKCSPFACETGQGSSCNVCRPQGARTSNDQCEKCNPGFRLLEDATCAAFSCRAGPGPNCKQCRAAADRTARDQCQACNAGFFLDDDAQCRPYTCSEGSGEACRRCTPQSQRSAHGQCKRCNPGHELTRHKTCRPFSCKLESMNCLECVEQPLRSGDNQCRKCQPGFKLSEDMKCVPYSCETGDGAACKICQVQGLRTGDDHCSTCNQGFTLVDGHCEAFTCQLGTASGCRTCRPLDERTAKDQCDECNAGYALNESGACVEYSCRTGSGEECKVCRETSARTGNNQCAECNADYVLTPSMRCTAKPQQWLPRVNAIVYTKEVVEDLFKQLDLNGDGKVTSDEFSKKEVDTAIAKALAKLAMDKAFDFQELRKPGDTDLVAIDRVFEKLDSDHDDFVSPPEFKEGVRSKKVSSSHLFGSVDENHDGRVSREEFTKAARGPAELRAMSLAFRRADADHDLFISQAEFIRDARTHYTSSTADELVPYFSKLDSDNDGRLSRVEFQAQAESSGPGSLAQVAESFQRGGEGPAGDAPVPGLVNPFEVGQ